MDPCVDIYVYVQTYSYISRVCGITFYLPLWVLQSLQYRCPMTVGSDNLCQPDYQSDSVVDGWDKSEVYGC